MRQTLGIMIAISIIAAAIAADDKHLDAACLMALCSILCVIAYSAHVIADAIRGKADQKESAKKIIAG